MIMQLNRDINAAWQFHVIWLSNSQQREFVICTQTSDLPPTSLALAADLTPIPKRIW